MKELEIILSVSCAALGLLVTSITFIMKFLKSAKAKKICEHIVEVGNAVIPYIKQAETFLNYSGAEKKEFVMTKANQYAIENGIRFDEALVSEKIEELVRLTKEVNKRDKDRVLSVPDSAQTA